MAENSNIRNQVEGFVKIMGDGDGGFRFREELKALKDVRVSKCADVLTAEQIAHIRDVIVPQRNECYRNATLVSLYLECEYVEGYYFASIVALNHAFNKVGDKYIDVTAEFALQRDPTDGEYATFAEYPAREAVERAVENGVYGELFADDLIKRFNEQEKG